MLFNSYQGPMDFRWRVIANNMSDARFTSSDPNASANLHHLGMMQPAPLGRLVNDYLESGKTNSKRAPASVAVIEPPPEIRRTAENTALLISKNGLDMERRVMALNINDARFRFLWSSDPYHAFYYLKLTEYRAQNQGRAQVIQSDSPASHECVGEVQFHLEPPQHLSTQMQTGMHPPLESQFAQLQVSPPPTPLHDECSSMIGDDWEVIDIPVVQLLSENVESLKEKTLGEIQIPANK